MEIEGELFHEIEEYNGKKFEHIGFKDKEKRFEKLIESLVPKIGMKKKAKIKIDILE